MNLTAVLIQILIPCPAPGTKSFMYGLIPTTYDVLGSPDGLARIDAVFGGNGYHTAFFLGQHHTVRFGVLYWSTMYSSSSTTSAARVSSKQYDLEAWCPVVGADEFVSDTAESADLSDEGEPDRPILYRSPNPNRAGVQSHGEPIQQHAVQATRGPGGSGRMHRHTSIHCESDSRGWSPVGNKGFVFPPVTR